MRPVQVTVVLLLQAMMVMASLGDVPDLSMFQWISPPLFREVCEANLQPCGPDWYRVNGSRCVKFISDKKTFDDAENFCQSLNEDGHLLKIKDKTDRMTCISVRMTCISVPDNCFYWVGAKRIQDGSAGFQWIDGSGNVEISVKDYNRNIDCLKVWSWYSGLMLSLCEAQLPFVCQKPV